MSDVLTGAAGATPARAVGAMLARATSPMLTKRRAIDLCRVAACLCPGA